MNVNTYNLCIGCMMPLGQESECRFCGLKQEEYSPFSQCLLPGTELAKRYVIGKVLGEGSFGITYIGWDKLLNVRIAIKEYFPHDLVRRNTICGSDNNVYLYKKEEKDNYESYISKFVNEARCLARFNHVKEIVSVLDFFKENNTAYIVMHYIDGVSVKDYIQKNGKMSAKQVLEKMKPVLKALGSVHDMNIIHRDLSPDNIMIRRNGSLVLIDFGAAKVRNIDSGKMTTLILKKGFSPTEQYNAKSKFAEYTDIYSICASMYYMMTEQIPQDSVMRIIEDDMQPLATMDGIDISVRQSKAVMKGMSVYAKSRWQTIDELFNALYGDKKDYNKRRYPLITVVVITILIAALVVSVYFTAGAGRIKENNISAAVSRDVRNNIQDAEKNIPKITGDINTTDTEDKLVSEHNKSPALISVCGLKKKEAQEKLAGYKSIKINWNKKYSDDVKKGIVISQSIPAGTKLKDISGMEMTITVSRGSEEVKVPKLTGLKSSAAKKKLVAIGLKYRIERIESDVQKGTVVEQGTDRGIRVKRGTCIKLMVSAGERSTGLQNNMPANDSDDDIVGVIR